MNLKNHQVKYMDKSDALSAYTKELNKLEPLTVEEEEALFDRIKLGDESARKELAKRNQRFIYAIAKRYAKDCNDVLDYVNEGTIGLLKAIDHFDPDLGYKFITFAVYYMRREMNYYMEVTNNMVKRPNNFKYGRKIEDIKRKYVTSHGYEPSLDEIAHIMKKIYGITIKDKTDLYTLNITSINENASSDSEDYSYEQTSDYNEKTSNEILFNEEVEEEYKAKKNKAIINKLIDNVPDRDEDGNDIKSIIKRNVEILMKYFGIGYDNPYSLDVLAEMYDVEKSVMRSIITNTIGYLRKYNRHLKKYLPI